MTSHIDSATLITDPSGTMIASKPVIAILTAALILAGCSAASRLESAFGAKYKYTYVLVSPTPAGKRAYLDKRIKILFLIDDGAVRFKLTNRSGENMTIDWSRASIGVLGRFYPVRNTSSYYAQDSNSIYSPPIPPNGYVIDLAIPAQNVSYTGSQWRERDLLPTTDRHSAATRARILGEKGKNIDLLLPMDFEHSGTVDYAFRFTITAVNELPWNRYRKPHRPPAPKPVNPVKFTTNDQWITAAIVLGVVGISAVLLTQKKSPPSE